MKRGLGLAAVMLLTGCGGGYEPDMAALEKQIDTDLTQQIDAPVEIDCPSSIEWRVGEDFKCTATVDGQTTLITVSMQNKDGEYVWQAG